MTFRMELQGWDEIHAKWLYFINGGLRKEMQEVANEFAPLLQGAIKARAPKESGGYASRITATVSGFEIRASSPDDFSDRLEYGFVGVDALGRHYNQAPQPHFRPAVDEILPQYIGSIQAKIHGRLV